MHVIAAGDESGERGGVQVHRTGPGERHRGSFSRIGNYLRFLRGARRILKRLVGPGDIVVLLTDPPLLASALTAPAHRRGARVIQWIPGYLPRNCAATRGRLERGTAVAVQSDAQPRLAPGGPMRAGG